jgi:hypothetical protein
MKRRSTRERSFLRAISLNMAITVCFPFYLTPLIANVIIAQCVWEKSTKVGIAAAKDSKGAWYTVARYTAAGNVVGKKPY